MNEIWNKIKDSIAEIWTETKACMARHRGCVFICFCIGSCSPMNNLDKPCPYAGVRADLNQLSRSCHDIGCLSQLFTTPLAMIELPFVFVVDSALAPIQSVRWLFSKDKRYQCEWVEPWFG